MVGETECTATLHVAVAHVRPNDEQVFHHDAEGTIVDPRHSRFLDHTDIFNPLHSERTLADTSDAERIIFCLRSRAVDKLAQSLASCGSRARDGQPSDPPSRH